MSDLDCVQLNLTSVLFILLLLSNAVSELRRVSRVRHAKKRYNRMGRGRQVCHGRVHRRGGAADQGATGPQATVHVFGSRGSTHG